MPIMMNKRSSNWSVDMAGVDLDVLRDGKILSPDNNLDPMFLLALEFSTKLAAMEDSMMKNNPTFEEILQVGIGVLLDRMKLVSEEDIDQYIKAVVALVQRQNDSGMMSKKFGKDSMRGQFEFYK